VPRQLTSDRRPDRAEIVLTPAARAVRDGLLRLGLPHSRNVCNSLLPSEPPTCELVSACSADLAISSAASTRRCAQSAWFITQRVGSTDISISYNRPWPAAELFGTLVRWGRMWHPAPTRDDDLVQQRRDDRRHALKAGRYTLWTIPEESKPWTVIFNRGVGGWHTNIR